MLLISPVIEFKMTGYLLMGSNSTIFCFASLFNGPFYSIEVEHFCFFMVSTFKGTNLLL